MKFLKLPIRVTGIVGFMSFALGIINLMKFSRVINHAKKN